MKIGIFYATYSGSTQAASEFLKQELETLGHQAYLKMINEVNFEDILNYDLRIFASPTWDYEDKEGQPHQDFFTFMNNCQGKSFENRPFVIMALGDSSYTHFCGAADVLENFIKNHQGIIKNQSLKIDGYLFDTEKNNQLISNWAKEITK